MGNIKTFFNLTPVEGNALEQLKKTFELPGMVKAVGMPDLHVGKGHPIGASFLSEKIIYPYLVGSDIGCGMALAMCSLKAHKAKRDKIYKKLRNLENDFEVDLKSLEEKFKINLEEFKSSLGTVGGGNHFLEVLSVESVENVDVFNANNLEKDKIFLMAHSGSRGLGESILRAHTDRFKSSGLLQGSKEFEEYFKRHNFAINWAKANREILIQKAASLMGEEYNFVLDIIHNWVEQTPQGFLHRKGTAPSDRGLVIIPGSRGDFSYLVKPLVHEDNLNSLAHGAGRKWKRGESKARLSEKYRPDDLIITDLKSQVICEDKDLLYEEAPENYKKISKVIQDLVDFKLIEVVAIFRPIVTYKKAKNDSDHED